MAVTEQHPWRVGRGAGRWGGSEERPPLPHQNPLLPGLCSREGVTSMKVCGDQPSNSTWTQQKPQVEAPLWQQNESVHGLRCH